jgi:hypothetical protein
MRGPPGKPVCCCCVPAEFEKIRLMQRTNMEVSHWNLFQHDIPHVHALGLSSASTCSASLTTRPEPAPVAAVCTEQCPALHAFVLPAKACPIVAQ